jgi:hypothetical protein
VLVLIVFIHVDDCIVVGEQVDVDWLKTEAKKLFTIKEHGPIKKWECGVTGAEMSMVAIHNLYLRISWRACLKSTRISLGDILHVHQLLDYLTQASL